MNEIFTNDKSREKVAITNQTLSLIVLKFIYDRKKKKKKKKKEVRSLLYAVHTWRDTNNGGDNDDDDDDDVDSQMIRVNKKEMA